MTANGEITLAVCLVAVLIFGNMPMFQSAIYHVKTCKWVIQGLSVSVSVRDSDGAKTVNFAVSKHSGLCVL